MQAVDSQKYSIFLFKLYIQVYLKKKENQHKSHLRENTLKNKIFTAKTFKANIMLILKINNIMIVLIINRFKIVSLRRNKTTMILIIKKLISKMNNIHSITNQYNTIMRIE